MSGKVFIGVLSSIGFIFGSLEANSGSAPQTPQVGSHQVPYCGDGPSPMHITLRHTEGKGVGYSTGYTTVDLFLSSPQLWINELTPFIDLRGHMLNNGTVGANAGVGLRYVDSRVWGANVYYDYRHTKHHNYNQISAGLETLGELFDFRIFGYFPIGKKTGLFYEPSFSHFSGNHVYMNQKREFAYISTNAEFGFSLDFFEKMPLYVATGPYYLHRKGYSAWGGALRVGATFLQCLTLQASTSYDHIFKWIGQGQIGLSVPFGGKSKIRARKHRSCKTQLALLRKATHGCDRNEIIPVGTETKATAAVSPLTGLPYTFIFVSSLGNSDGSFENPWKTVQEAEQQIKDQDIKEPVVYVSVGNGTPYQGTHTMANNERLWGSGTEHNLPLKGGSNFTIPATTSEMPIVGSSPIPHISGYDVAPLVTCADRTSVQGVKFILGENGTGVSGNNLEDCRITRCAFECKEVAATAVSLEKVTTCTLEKSTITITADDCTGFHANNCRGVTTQGCLFTENMPTQDCIHTYYEECEGDIYHAGNRHEFYRDNTSIGVSCVGTKPELRTCNIINNNLYSIERGLPCKAVAVSVSETSDFVVKEFKMRGNRCRDIGDSDSGAPIRTNRNLTCETCECSLNTFDRCTSSDSDRAVVPANLLVTHELKCTWEGNAWTNSKDLSKPSLSLDFRGEGVVEGSVTHNESSANGVAFQLEYAHYVDVASVETDPNIGDMEIKPLEEGK